MDNYTHSIDFYLTIIHTLIMMYFPLLITDGQRQFCPTQSDTACDE